ncbi:unnamed protein product [Meganyctiphanes norvegica]|uniref:MYND-type domain-containing protein n=1 Tax=Meganyctiphanes norvegica TaxID=48144 RepID=A0AAV2S2N5_MEGNR
MAPKAKTYYSFSNDSVEYPNGLCNILSKILLHREFIVGICSSCYTIKDSDHHLNWCSGCQLVAYCSKECQKKDLDFHKHLCKQYLLKNGKNVFSEYHKLTKEAKCVLNNELILKILDAARDGLEAGIISNTAEYNAMFSFAMNLITWAQRCNVCHEARVHKLTECKCLCVSHCSKGFCKVDKNHKDECSDLLVYARTISYIQANANNLNLPMNKKVDKEYHPLTTMEISSPSIKEDWLDAKLAILSERLSFPLTILYAMQESGLGTNKTPVDSVTSLTIHIVSSMPMLDSRMWEMLVHRLPHLNELNISFIGCNMDLKNQLNIDITNKLERCADCKLRKRLITYSIRPEHYHMYFSSLEYSEPDVIAVFNIKQMNKYKISSDDYADDVNSYQNMTYEEGTLIVLTGLDYEEVKEGIKEINEARPVDVVMSTRRNLFKGSRIVRSDEQRCILNTRAYMACIRRK